MMRQTGWFRNVGQRVKGFVYDTSGFVEGLRRIGALELTQDLKARVRKTHVQTILRRRYDPQRMIADVAGYQMRFLRFQSLAYSFDEIFVAQQYHFDVAKTTPFIVDCGSNIGMSVLYFKMIYPDSEILAFEPDRDAFACLETNVRTNGLKSVRLQMSAVSNTEGMVHLYGDPDEPGSLRTSTVKERMPNQGRPAEAVRLSTYIDREIDLLKLDVEGAEYDILEELRAAGKLPRIGQMVIEFHHHVLGKTDVLSRTLRLLEDAGLGYQIRACMKLPFRRQKFQDILIYAYRK